MVNDGPGELCASMLPRAALSPRTRLIVGNIKMRSHLHAINLSLRMTALIILLLHNDYFVTLHTKYTDFLLYPSSYIFCKSFSLYLSSKESFAYYNYMYII